MFSLEVESFLIFFLIKVGPSNETQSAKFYSTVALFQIRCLKLLLFFKIYQFLCCNGIITISWCGVLEKGFHFSDAI